MSDRHPPEPPGSSAATALHIDAVPESGLLRTRLRRRRSRGRWLRRLVALAAMVGLLWGAGKGLKWAWYAVFPAKAVQMGADPANRINVLAIGIDPKPLPVETTDKASRRLADTLMLFSLDPVANRAFVLSIPRETKATLGSAGEGVLGDALALGGIPMVRDTVEELTGLAIQHYVALDVDAARQIITHLGGIDIYVPRPITFSDKHANLGLDLKTGWHALSPEETLAYSYQRTEDELDRLERQQMLVRTWHGRLAESWNPLWRMQLATKAMGAVETDLPKRDFEQVLDQWRTIPATAITYGLLPGDANRRGEWVISPKRWDDLQPRLAKVPGNRNVAEIKPSVEVLYDDAEDSQVMKLAETLSNEGFQVVRTARFPVDQDETVITDRLRPDERSLAMVEALNQAVKGARFEVSADPPGAYSVQVSVRLGKPFFASSSAASAAAKP